MKSKTRKNSNSSPKSKPRASKAAESYAEQLRLAADVAQGLTPDVATEMMAIGHRDETSSEAKADSTKDPLERVRIFQSNFLSLISHELRTPLSTIRNALVMLEENVPEPKDALIQELLQTALRNATRLDHQLSSLLDLAELEASAFNARLREVDLFRIGKQKAESYGWKLKSEAKRSNSNRVLADPKKVQRIFELFKDIGDHWGAASSEGSVSLSARKIRFSFKLKPGQDKDWDENWTRAKVAVQSGVHRQFSFFEGALQSEQDFLSRGREGLGSELLILNEIVRRHDATFEMSRETESVALEVAFASLDDRAAFERVLSSRLSSLSAELGSVALILVRPDKNAVAETFERLEDALFRASDSIYSLDNGVIALLMDDVRGEDLPVLVERLCNKLDSSTPVASVHAPTDGLEPRALFDLALSRL